MRLPSHPTSSLLPYEYHILKKKRLEQLSSVSRSFPRSCLLLEELIEQPLLRHHRLVPRRPRALNEPSAFVAIGFLSCDGSLVVRVSPSVRSRRRSPAFRPFRFRVSRVEGRPRPSSFSLVGTFGDPPGWTVRPSARPLSSSQFLSRIPFWTRTIEQIDKARKSRSEALLRCVPIAWRKLSFARLMLHTHPIHRLGKRKDRRERKRASLREK